MHQHPPIQCWLFAPPPSFLSLSSTWPPEAMNEEQVDQRRGATNQPTCPHYGVTPQPPLSYNTAPRPIVQMCPHFIWCNTTPISSQFYQTCQQNLPFYLSIPILLCVPPLFSNYQLNSPKMTVKQKQMLSIHKNLSSSLKQIKMPDFTWCQHRWSAILCKGKVRRRKKT